VSSHSEKSGNALRAKGVIDVAPQGKGPKALRLPFAHPNDENDALIAQAQVVETAPSVMPPEPNADQAGSVVYIEVPSQFEPSKTGENEFGSTHKASGIWDFSLADVDPALYGFLGVVVAGELAIRETEKQSAAPSNASAQTSLVQGASSVALDPLQVTSQGTSLASEVNLFAKNTNLRNDVSPIRVDLRTYRVELGSTLEVSDGSKSLGKVVLGQSDVDNQFVDLKPSTEPESRQHLKVSVYKAGASVASETFWLDAQGDQISQGSHGSSSSDLLASAWGHDSSHQVMGDGSPLDKVI